MRLQKIEHSIYEEHKLKIGEIFAIRLGRDLKFQFGLLYAHVIYLIFIHWKSQQFINYLSGSGVVCWLSQGGEGWWTGKREKRQKPRSEGRESENAEDEVERGAGCDINKTKQLRFIPIYVCASLGVYRFRESLFFRSNQLNHLPTHKQASYYLPGFLRRPKQ